MGRFRFGLVGGCRRVRLGMDWNTAKANTAEAKDRAEPRPGEERIAVHTLAEILSLAFVRAGDEDEAASRP